VREPAAERCRMSIWEMSGGWGCDMVWVGRAGVRGEGVRRVVWHDGEVVDGCAKCI
jgi:hypothetical protein